MLLPNNKNLFKKTFFYKIISICKYSSSESKAEVRVRFAPSPTGKLHIGGLRTAFYNYLLAKKYNGKFLLRIEDTDRDRIKENSLENIFESLKWAGIEPDYGPHKKQSDDDVEGAPWVQSQRLNLYNKHADILVESKKAYRCFCDENRLILLRRNAAKHQEKIGYDGKCRNLSESTVKKYLDDGRKYVVRFKLDDKDYLYDDMTSGKHISNPGKQEGDFVIVKSDGYPTYHFASVVDDHLMRITHVLRGQEWQLSTAKHIALYESFGWNYPKYAHLPLICNKDGSKISKVFIFNFIVWLTKALIFVYLKRQDDIDLLSFKERGYMPESILAYLSSIGGGSKVNIFNDNSFFKSFKTVLNDLVLNFDETKISSRSIKLNQDLLDNINKRLIKLKIKSNDINELVLELKHLVEKKNLSNLNPIYLSDEYLANVINWTQDRVNKICDLVNEKDFSFLWSDMSNFTDNNLVNKSHLLELIEHLNEYLSKPNTDLKNSSNLKQELKLLFEKLKQTEEANKKSNYWQLTRLILIGSLQGPSIIEIFNILGKENVIFRLKMAKECLWKN